MPTDFLAHGEPARCLGRERELAFLQDLLHDAALGYGSVTILAGASGSGKSRLLQECSAVKTSVAMVHLQCSAAPLRGNDLRAQIEGVPALTTRKPVALLVDDVHLAGDRDLETLDALAAVARTQRIAMVATVLDDGNTTLHAGPTTKRWSGAHSCGLEPLGDETMELLVHGLLKAHGTAFDGNLVREIIQSSRGNPRFAVELAECASQAAAPSALVAPSARATIERARRELPAESFEILLLCSAIGDRFDDELIESVSQRSPAAIAQALQEACDLCVVTEDRRQPGSFAFAHPAVRKAAYRSMITPKRRLLHERIVRRLGALNRVPSPAFLADQWDALDDHRQVLATLTNEAQRLAANRNFAAAAELFERAASRVEAGTPEWLLLARPLVECYRKTGSHARVIPIVETMRSMPDLHDYPDAAFALEQLFFAYLNDCDHDRAAGVAAELALLRCAKAPDLERRARLVLAYAYANAGHAAHGARFMAGMDEADIVDHETRWRYLLAKLALDGSREPLTELLALADRAASIGIELGIAGAVFAYTQGVAVALWHGDLPAAQSYLDRAETAARTRPHVAGNLHREIAKNSARLQLIAGKLSATRALVVSNLGWRDSGKYNEAFHAGVAVYVGMRSGDLSLVDAFFDPALLSTAVALRDAELCGLLLPGFAEVMQVRGLGGALNDALSACVDGALIDPYLSIQLCAARYGSADSLERIERQIESYARNTVAPIAGAHVALVSATLARRRGTPGIAQKLGRSAAAAYRRFGWRLHEAMALELAGDPEDAAKTYRACGAGADVARITAGQSRKLGRAPFGASLTPREREVARLVARRRSDREIAHALELSVRTVHHHVEAIFSKLGVKRRVQITESFLDEPHAR